MCKPIQHYPDWLLESLRQDSTAECHEPVQAVPIPAPPSSSLITPPALDEEDENHLAKTTDLIRYAIQSEAYLPFPVPAQPTTRPVATPPVVSPMMPAPLPIVHRTQSYEREEWPG